MEFLDEGPEGGGVCGGNVYDLDCTGRVGEGADRHASDYAPGAAASSAEGEEEIGVLEVVCYDQVALLRKLASCCHAVSLIKDITLP